MSKLQFDSADVRRVCLHSIHAPKQGAMADWETANEENGWTPKRSVPTEPHVILVHDDGVYLMSNGEPRDEVRRKYRATSKKTTASAFTAHAAGTDPLKFPDSYWDTARDLVGGDDFGEWLPWARALLKASEAGPTVTLEFTANRIAILEDA